MTGSNNKERLEMKPLKAFHKRLAMFLVNKVFVGTRPCFYEIKRKLLNSIGHTIGEGTRIVGPFESYSSIEIGKECFIGKNFKVNGNGKVIIGDRCDIAPEVTFQTGGHEIGDKNRRAGKGRNFCQKIGSGTWIGGRSTICNEVEIGSGCVIAGCACVIKSIPDNVLVGGVPAKIICEL